MSTTIHLALRLLTPAFLGGADQKADLRPPSIKGALRFWYRAADSGFREKEGRLFGSTDTGQSAVLLRVDPVKFSPSTWDAQGVQRRFTEGGGKFAKNGLVYLGFALQLRGNEARSAIPAGTAFTLRCVMPRPLREPRDRRAILAALWTFATCGALGMRSRRGFGSLSLEGWDADGTEAEVWNTDMAQLPALNKAADAALWVRGYDQGQETVRSWLDDGGRRRGKNGGSKYDGPHARTARHPHFGPDTLRRLSPEAFNDWERALNHAGRQLQDYRLRRAPDYEHVKEHLRFRSHEGGIKLRMTPERAAFGLPLAFRYSSLKTRVTSTIFVPHNRDDHARGTPLERHPSPLLLKLVRLPDGLHSLWLRLDGPRPGTEPPAAERNAPQPLAPPSRDIVGEFIQSLSANKGQ